jgi:hypothetical protein
LPFALTAWLSQDCAAAVPTARQVSSAAQNNTPHFNLEARVTMVACGLLDHEQDFIDSLHVMEIGMRHFLTKAMTAKANKGKPEVVDENMLQAVSIAEKIAPYRHARLSAVKLAGDPNSPVRFKDDATADELRERLCGACGYWLRLA